MSAAESELLARYAKTRDAEAFRSLVEKHSDMVFAACKRIVGNAADAEDIAQDCFILLSRHAAMPATRRAGKLRAPVAGWLHQVAVRISINFLRDKRVRRSHESRAMLQRLTEEKPLDEVKSAADEAIAVLPERFRTPIILHYLEGRKQEEIAAELGINQSTVSKRLNRGVALLRKHLRGAGFAAPAAAALLLTMKAAEASPPSLISSLGKLALSGVATSTKVAAANVGVIGGMSVMKIGAVTAVAASVIIAGGIAAQSLKAQAPAKPVAQNTKLETNPNSKIQNPKSTPPAFGADAALVKDLMQLDKLAQAEKQAGRMRIDLVNLQTWALGDDGRILRGTALIEVTAQMLAAENIYSEVDKTLKMGEMSLLDGIRFYDMQGRKLSFDTEQTGNHKCYYFIHLIDPLARGGSVRFAVVVDKVISLGVMWKDGALRHFFIGDGSNYCLEYSKAVLPESAIFVDSWPRAMSVDTVGNCTAVTIRRYKAENADWRQTIVFLWPKKDATSLTSLPPEYCGLRDPRDVESAQKYQREMSKILEGGDYHNQSTPLDAVLTRNCAIVKQDGALYVNSVYVLHQSADKAQDFLANQPARLAPMRTYCVDDIGFLSTPAWPDKPKDGYVHPVYMCYPDTLIRKDTYGVIYDDGKWYIAGDVENPYSTDVLQFSPELQVSDIPWNNAGKEARDRYEKFVAMRLGSPNLWTELGLKLVGAGFWDEALDSFSRSETLAGEDPSRVIAVIWEGHIYDVMGERDKALAAYTLALKTLMEDYSSRHDQWNITLNRSWIEERLKDPFVPQMIGKEAK